MLASSCIYHEKRRVSTLIVASSSAAAPRLTMDWVDALVIRSLALLRMSRYYQVASG
jgi:hypothetical protein